MAQTIGFVDEIKARKLSTYHPIQVVHIDNVFG